MYTHKYTYIHTYTHACTRVQTYIYAYTHTHTYTISKMKILLEEFVVKSFPLKFDAETSITTILSIEIDIYHLLYLKTKRRRRRRF